MVRATELEQQAWIVSSYYVGREVLFVEGSKAGVYENGQIPGEKVIMLQYSDSSHPGKVDLAPIEVQVSSSLRLARNPDG